MFQIKIAKGIAVLSVLVGIMVIFGWFFDITVLTSIMPDWIRMKIATAVCFIFSGFIIYLLSYEKEERSEIISMILIVFSMFLVLIMGTLFLGSIFGFQTGMENIAFVSVHELKTPIFQGRPSVATMICFLLIALIGLLFSLNSPAKKTFFIIGSIIGIIGFVGVLGYVLNMPVLYYEIPGLSNAIAVHTTGLFALLGSAIYLIGNQQKQ